MPRAAHKPEVLDPKDPLVIQEEEGLSAPEIVAPKAELMLMPVMDLQVAKQRLAEFQQFVSEYMKKDEDYGIIPGVDKPSLFQPGADKLSELYGLAPTFPDERTIRNVDWTMTPPLFDYEVTCVLLSKRTGMVVAEGKGSCSSYEAKYRWRDSRRKCPHCQAEAIIKGKEEWGGGYICWDKRGGCKAKFKDGDQAIEGQTVGRIPNEDIADIKNTILKMAQKRAKIAAVLCATRSSGVFTQDVEDMNGHSHEEKPREGEPMSGTLIDPTMSNGDLWMRIGKDICVASKRRKELISSLSGLHGEWVEVTVGKQGKTKGGSKTFFEIQAVRRIGTPDTPVMEDQDIPF
jgi:hypothetical protein